ncbi:MAG: rubredoxin [Nitrospinae bacterium RIFCSPLOWO2_02_FULL_39_110]|nr:MAG: rubredoxin [Nitrospinae bacterium RIFCSPHIGHO2_12_FULL_39_42]OGV98897.1 MAG: rubredoxin [Nitrospinae bacterium RIFCSPHIGHO2_02_39_11]OGW03230.1 MAG: rubredoxin [Nitrospinae bacterium RIFCSPHIGHO2_02_FULL_39_82]OGW06046.1 MAG: rubredoxin [Nitrospinae bacterium RIFCSPLOWO2_02_39_17]OGW06696.1 MAG: rubredoxin [Nitrospinae bacterium RIFCSPLOWO2_02_FULL_39_110]OGW11106.1 MAG: rubredoxin [Nitrospinae bacterium RIFCSPLOWO2_12_39_15]
MDSQSIMGELWRCTCGYVYNPMLGDTKGGIKPGIKFKDLPANWVCPSCGLPKEKFEKME